MKASKVAVLATTAALALGACSSTPGSSAGASGGGGGGTAVKIGIELPMTGGEAPNGVPTANGVALALEKVQVPGFSVSIEQKDDAVNGKHDPNQGAQNMQALASDPQIREMLTFVPGVPRR